MTNQFTLAIDKHTLGIINSISIYYSDDKWHEILKNIILFENCFPGSVALEYIIFLSTEGGPHIHIYFKGDRGLEYNLLVSRFILFFQKFLLESPSDDEDITYPLKHFFKNVPNNTLVPNAESQTFYFLDNLDYKNAYRITSKAIVNAFSDSINDFNAVHTFLLYIQIGFIRSAFNSLDAAREYINKLLTDDGFHKNIGDLKREYADAKIAYENNQEMISEIIKDIWNISNLDVEFTWLINWINDCITIFKLRPFHERFILISRIIFDQFGDPSGKQAIIYSNLTLTMFFIYSKHSIS
jgi:hypothetical protein